MTQTMTITNVPHVPPQDVPGLNAIRGLAAAAVVATHVGFSTGTTSAGAFGAMVSRLDIGVSIFFLLSGFLLYRPWVWRDAGLAGPVNTPRYFLKRFLRIFPLYWVVLAVALIAVADNHSLGPTKMVANATLTQIYLPDALVHALTQAWSLATEVSFYLVLPLLAWLIGRISRTRSGRWRPGRAYAALLVLALIGTAFVVVAREPASPLPPQSGFWLPYSLVWFALGMALAVTQSLASAGTLPRLSRACDQAGSYLGTCWAVSAGAFVLAATPIAGPRAFEAPIASWDGAAKLWLYGVAAFFLLLPLVALPEGEGPIRRALQSRVARWFADTSYGVFLWHLLILEAVFAVLRMPHFAGGFWPVFALTYGVTLLLSWGTFHAIERPFIRLSHRRRAGSPAVGSTG